MREPRPRDVWKCRRNLYTALDISPLAIEYIEKANGRKVYEAPHKFDRPPGFTRTPPPLPAVKTLGRMASATYWDGRPADLIDSDLVPAVWEAVRRSVAAGRPPPPEAVAAFFLRWPVPDDLREFVLDQHCGRVKRPRGPDPEDPFASFEEGGTERAAWIYRVARYWRVYASPRYARERDREARRRSGRSKPPRWNAREMAFEAVADEAGVSVRQLEAWYYWKP